jgi:hypothetical protein
MEGESENSKISVTFRGNRIELPFLSELTVADLKLKVAEAGGADMTASDIKLLFKGRVLSEDKELLVSVVGTKPGKIHRIIALGASKTEQDDYNQKFEERLKETGRIRNDLTIEGQRELLRRQKLGQRELQKAAARNATNRQPMYGFGKIETLPSLPEESKAREILMTLANDPGVLSCMAKHRWNVASLAELYPEGQVGQSAVCVMGLNKNKGQQILLRIRTDDLKGFRKILSIRKVLYHELAHNVHSEHDQAFFDLMRQIEKDCTEMDWTQGTGLTSNLMKANPDTEGGIFRLGGNETYKTMSARELAARAAELRLTAEEQEICNNCGCDLGDKFLLKDSEDRRANCLL